MSAVDGKSAFVVVDMQNDYCHDEGTYPRNGLKCFEIEKVVETAANAIEEMPKKGKFRSFTFGWRGIRTHADIPSTPG